MAVKTREEIIASINTIVGENNSDEVLSLIEDVTDTFQDGETMRNKITELENQYNENDAAWRKKYRDRFNEGTSHNDEDEFEDPNEKPPKRYRYEDLFKEG